MNKSTPGPEAWDAEIDRWLAHRTRERKRKVALKKLRLAVPFCLLCVLMLIMQIYIWLFWAFLATVLAGYLGLGGRRRS